MKSSKHFLLSIILFTFGLSAFVQIQAESQLQNDTCSILDRLLSGCNPELDKNIDIDDGNDEPIELPPRESNPLGPINCKEEPDLCDGFEQE